MKIIFTLFLSIFITSLHAQDEFVVKVKMNNPKQYSMVIAYPKEGNYFVDTSFIREGDYRVFKGSVPSLQVISFIVRNPEGNIKLNDGFIPAPSLKLLVQNGAVLIVDGDAERPWAASVQSTNKEIAQYEVFSAKDKILEDKGWSLTKQAYANTGNEKLTKELEEKQKFIQAESQEWQKEFVRKHPGSYAALEVLSLYSYELNAGDLEKQFAALPSTYKNTPLGKSMSDKIRATANTKVGKKAIFFTQPGIDGLPVDIAALKGRYVLIDFWGSWCGPCRESHPHLKELYTKYKNKGFEIVGVATESGTPDRQQAAWKDAVKTDGINWLQVLNDPDKTDIVKTYGIAAFPTRVLLDKNGIIIMRYTGSEEKELDEKLQELFGK